MGEGASDLPARLGGDGKHDALGRPDGARQVGLQYQLARQVDAGQEAVVATRLANLVEPLGDMAPESDLVLALMQQSRQSGAPRAGAQYGDVHDAGLSASDGDGFLKLMRCSVPLIRRWMLALCL